MIFSFLSLLSWFCLGSLSADWFLSEPKSPMHVGVRILLICSDTHHLIFLAGTYSSVFDYCAGRCCHCSESVVSILLHSSYLVLEILTFRNVLIWLPLITYTTSHLQGCLWPYSIKKKIPFMATDFCQTWFRSFSH